MAEITNFNELIQDYIGPHKTIEEKHFSNLLAPGENYFSDIKKIHVILKNKETGAKETLDLVAKCCIINEFGPTFHLMCNEINFYKNVIPALKKFQEKHGGPSITFFPELVGARLNLTGSEKPDNDAVIVQKNLKIEGYEMQDRHVGFNLATTKVILKDIAIYHATALSLKLSEPETFNNEIKEQCPGFEPPPPPPSPKGDDKTPMKDSPPNFLPIIAEYVKTNKELSHIQAAFEKFSKRMEEDQNHFKAPPPKEPFCTLLHTDLWVNNTMPKIIEGVAVGNIFVDFQMCKIGSPVEDLIFFLVSSVQSLVLKSEFDNLIKYYHEEFRDVLKKYNCYSPQFSYDKFLEELKENAERPIRQCTFMLPIAVFNKKGSRFDIKHQLKSEDLPELAKDRLSILLLEAYKRKWIV